MTTLPLALAATLALQANPPPARGPEVARWRRLGALCVGAEAALLTAHVAWSWGEMERYQDFILGDDPGPSVSPVPLVTPFAAPPVAAAAGVLYLEALGRERGVEARVPAWYWLGLAPMVASLRAMASADPETGVSLAHRRTIVAGTVASFAWFAGATALLAWRLPEGPAPAAGSAGLDLSLDPLTIRAPRGSVTGLALSGRF